MKNDKLNNNTNFNKGFGMSNEEMNQIVGGSTFFTETVVMSTYASENLSTDAFDGISDTNFLVSECTFCQSNTLRIDCATCKTQKK